MVDWRRSYAQAAVIQAEGEAEAATLISDALKESGSGVIEVRRIDVSEYVDDDIIMMVKDDDCEISIINRLLVRLPLLSLVLPT